uniref:Uncharacterized protein n=1 Tax=Anguilla anguilla TaxID=7936 RepID=A0A0E9XZA2_ANGAN
MCEWSDSGDTEASCSVSE